jgi:hypothetical protein
MKVVAADVEKPGSRSDELNQPRRSSAKSSLVKVELGKIVRTGACGDLFSYGGECVRD